MLLMTKSLALFKQSHGMTDADDMRPYIAMVLFTHSKCEFSNDTCLPLFKYEFHET